MSDADDITQAWIEGIDAARAVLFNDPTLSLVERKSGQNDIQVGVIVSGWFPTEERKEAEVDTLVMLEIGDGVLIDPPDPADPLPQVDPLPLTQTHITRASRVIFNSIRYTVETWNAPQEAPRRWVLFLREIKEGSVKK